MGRKLPWLVWPEDTGGIGTYQAQQIVTGMLLRMGELFGVSIGPWSGCFDLHRKLGVIKVKLEFTMWKKGWNPPPQPEPAPKPSKKKKSAKKATSRKSSKKAG